MKFPTREEVAEIRACYSEGTRVRLLKMDDSQAPEIGTLGTVRNVDDIGTIMVNWDSGGCLGIIKGIDECEKV